MARKRRNHGCSWILKWTIACLPLATTIEGCASPRFGMPFTDADESGSSQTLPEQVSTYHSVPPTAAQVPSRYPLARMHGAPKAHQDTVAAIKSDPSNSSAVEGSAKVVSSTLRRAKDALSISPRATPAPDPISLAYDSRAIGPDVFVSSARVFEHRGKTDKAIAHYCKALEIDPNNRNALIGYARLQHRQGDLEEAVRMYNRVIGNAPDDAVALNDLGLCYARQGRLNQAISVLSQAVQVRPESARYQNNIATVLIEANRVEEALAHLVRVHGPAKAHFNLGYLMKQRGNVQLALQFFAKASELDPSMTAAQSILSQHQWHMQSVASNLSTGGTGSKWNVPVPADTIAVPAGDPRITQIQSGKRAAIQSALVPSQTTTSDQGRPIADAPRPSASPYYLQGERNRVGPFGYDPVTAGAKDSVLRLPENSNAPTPSAEIAPIPTHYGSTSSGRNGQGGDWPQFLPPVSR